jgi:uncharacterized protein (TIGR02145 family)
MKKSKKIITITCVFFLLVSSGKISGNNYESAGSDSEQTGSKSVQTVSKSSQTSSKTTQTSTKTVQTKTKAAQTGSKTVQTKAKSAQTGSKPATTKSKSIQKSPKTEPVIKNKDLGTVSIGTQKWAVANLNVSTFRNGDTIPEAKTNKDWVAAGDAGKPAWCYYNNDPALGLKYGKLYNWYAVNDPRGLAPEGWTLASDADWAQLSYSLGGQSGAGMRLKSISGWSEGNNGTNETGFIGLPGGYRIENGIFQNLGSIGIWWSTAEGNSLTAVDHYLAQSGTLGRSNSPRQRGESVRCLRK